MVPIAKHAKTGPNLPESSPSIRKYGVVAVVPGGTNAASPNTSGLPTPSRRSDCSLIVIKRSHLVRSPGAHCFPGGAIESGESEQEALVREMTEELNVDSRPVRKLWHSVTPGGISLAWWLADIGDQVPTPNPAEVEDYQLLTIEQIHRLPTLLRSNRAFLAAVKAGEFTLSIS